MIKKIVCNWFRKCLVTVLPDLQRNILLQRNIMLFQRIERTSILNSLTIGCQALTLRWNAIGLRKKGPVIGSVRSMFVGECLSLYQLTFGIAVCGFFFMQ